jgi:capsular exopolysaccharide synthesis family protein
VDLLGTLGVVRRRWLALLICLLAGAGGGWYAGHSGPKSYTATSRVIVNVPSSQILSEAVAGVQLSSSFMGTYADLASSRAVAQRVVQQFNLPISAEQMQGKIAAAVVPNTFIISISVSDEDPARAASLANEVPVALHDQVQQTQQGRTDQASVQPLDQADIPTTPHSPRPKLDLAVGLTLGVVAGILLLAALEALDRSVHTTAQVDGVLHTPLLATVPKHRGRDRTLVAADERDPMGEPYRTLRTAIRYLDPDRPLRSLVVSSAAPGDGKTTVAANLAVSLASAGLDVIVVDADLRRPALAATFGIEPAVGLTSVIIGDYPLVDALQQWRPNLHVLPSGPLPPNPSELLGSAAAAAVVDELVRRCDIVLFDTPPVLPVTDAVVLATQTDGMLLVTRHATTNRAALATAKRQIATVGVTLLGYVYNGVRATAPGGYYYYEERRSLLNR